MKQHEVVLNFDPVIFEGFFTMFLATLSDQSFKEHSQTMLGLKDASDLSRYLTLMVKKAGVTEELGSAKIAALLLYLVRKLLEPISPADSLEDNIENVFFHAAKMAGAIPLNEGEHCKLDFESASSTYKNVF